MGEIKKISTLSLLLAAALFVLPVFTVGVLPTEAAESSEIDGAEAALPIARTVAAAKDRGRAVRLQMSDGTVEELSMSDYLWGVVAAEMPASFEPEALKAQACAARTYTVILQNAATEKHPGADICGDSTCCQAYLPREQAEARWGLNAKEYGEKLESAVSATDGLGILYQGEPIQALFFSSAAGKTVDSVAVWGNAVEYLKSVDSPEGEEVPNYHTQVTLSAEEVKSLTLTAYPGADLSGDPSGWFGAAAYSGETVTSITLGGITLTGGQVRSLFSLRSASFTVAWDGSMFTFAVTGYGHGVGMSQYGANALAGEGMDFRDILTWYYTGTEIDALW
jgi:stage II sporulation protein D